MTRTTRYRYLYPVKYLLFKYTEIKLILNIIKIRAENFLFNIFN